MNRLAWLFLTLYALSTIGCNVLSSMDTPSAPIDKYNAAVAKADAGDCIGARDLLVTIPTPDDNTKIALGWAYLCMSGATATSIAGSLYKYSSGTKDITVLGVLARTLLPMDSTKLSYIELAITSFSDISVLQVRNLEIAIAKFVKSASILANQAGNTTSTGVLERTDIGPTACQLSDCSAAVGVCTETGGMSDADVSNFVTTINEAASSLSTAGAADLQALAEALKLGLGAGSEIGRCYVYNSIIPSS